MGLFTRRARDQPIAPTTNNNIPLNNMTTDKTGHHGHTRTSRQPLVLSYSQRPPFGQWLKATWLDILTMAIMGVIGLGVYEAHPAPTRSFPGK